MDISQANDRGENRPDPQYLPEFYEIWVQGELGSQWAQWFEGMKLSVEKDERGSACTMIAGPVADQPALHGLLIKVRDLNLKLISVRRIVRKTKTGSEIEID